MNWVAPLIMAAAFLVGAAAILLLREERLRAERRDVLLRYSAVRSDDRSLGPTADQVGVVPLVDRFLGRWSWTAKAAEHLDKAGLGLSIGQWFLIRWGIALGLALVITLLTGAWFIALIIGFLLAFLGAQFFLERRTAKRRAEFEASIPEFFSLMASSMRAGLPFLQAIEAASEEGGREIERQLRRVVTEARMGVNPEDALLGVAERMGSQDMKWAAGALALGRQVGGNVSQILDTVAETVRQRAEVQRQAQVLSAEGRTSARVMVMLPIGVFLLLFITQRSYIQPLLDSPIGWAALGGAAVLIAVGWFWVQRVSKVKV